MKAIGLIEVRGIVGAIEAADVALKAAQVELVSRQKVKAGFTALTFEGDVGAVKAALEAATVAVERLGVLIASHVIPRPDDSVEILLNRNGNIAKTEQELSSQDLNIEETEKTQEVEEEKFSVLEEAEEIKEKEEKIKNLKPNKKNKNKK